MLKNRTPFITLLLCIIYVLIFPEANAQTVLQRAKLSSASEDMTYISTGPLAGQFAILDGFNVLAFPDDGSALATKLFDFRNVPLQDASPRGITYVESLGLFAVNDTRQSDKIFFVDENGLLVEEDTITIQYEPGYMPDHVEGMCYIPSDTSPYPNHIAMVVVDYDSIVPVKILIINLDGEIAGEIIPEQGYYPVGIDFQAPSYLMAGDYRLYKLDFFGNIVSGPEMSGDSSGFEGVVSLPSGYIYSVGYGNNGKLDAWDSDLDRLPDDDLTYATVLGLGQAIGLAWNSDTDQHIISDTPYDGSAVRFAFVPPDLETADFLTLDPQIAGFGYPLTYLPDFQLIAMRLSSSYYSIGLFNEDGVLVSLIDTSTLGLGYPSKISYIPQTQQLVVAFSNAPNPKTLYLLSLDGYIDNAIDLTDAPINFFGGGVTFFNPSHPTGGQFLIFEYASGGPLGTHRAIITDFNGKVLSEFDYLDSLNTWKPYDIAAITTGPYAGAFSVLDIDTRELIVWQIETTTEVEILTSEVEALMESGELTQNQSDGLIDKLDAAISSLELDNTRAACNQLRAFINQVNAFIRAGKISVEEGQALIDYAIYIQNEIGY